MKPAKPSTPAGALTPIDVQTLTGVADCLRALQTRDGWEPTVKQLLALIYLGTSPDPAPDFMDVGTAIGATNKPAVTRALDRLEAEGWARRQGHESDRRRVRVAITPAGREALRGMAAGGGL